MIFYVQDVRSFSLGKVQYKVKIVKKINTPVMYSYVYFVAL